MTISAARWAAVAGAACLVCACSSFGRLPTQYSVHDLGATTEAPTTLALPTRSIQVRAPSWLGSSAMQYRAADPGSLTRRAYVSNRWAAAPAELVELALQRSLAASNPNGGGCVLAVELDEFIQVFPSATQSYGLIEARLRLSSPRDDAVFAIKPVSINVPATTADARGGAQALSIATGELATSIAAWLHQLDSEMPGVTTGSARCR